MSKVVLPKGFPCSIENGTFNKRTDFFPYYHNDVDIIEYKLNNDVVVESGWSSKNILIKFIDNNFKPVVDSKGQLTSFELTSTGTIEMIKERSTISHVLSVLTNLGSTQNMSNELAKMGVKFNFPKPIELIVYLLSFYCDNNSIVLDSFAGSGTTAHAVLNMNKADNGSRKFILVEMEDYAETITAERVRRVIEGYGENKGKVDGTGGSFAFYDLGDRLLLEDGNLNPSVSIDKIREYIFFTETKCVLEQAKDNEPHYLGTHIDTAYYFNFETDKATILNGGYLSNVKTSAQQYVIYADTCTLSAAELEKYHITFKKIPRDITKL